MIDEISGHDVPHFTIVHKGPSGLVIGILFSIVVGCYSAVFYQFDHRMNVLEARIDHLEAVKQSNIEPDGIAVPMPAPEDKP